jgi:hypothetical protein
MWICNSTNGSNIMSSPSSNNNNITTTTTTPELHVTNTTTTPELHVTTTTTAPELHVTTTSTALRRVLSFDVGIINLAYVKCVVDVEQWTVIKVEDARVIDLTRLPHLRVPEDQCQLPHSRDIYDRMSHFFQEFDPTFVDVDRVVIERQPLGGLCHVEQLLFGHFRSRAFLVLPNCMHKFFNIRHLDYEGRKQRTAAIAAPALAHLPEWQNRERVHDLADAWCLLVYDLHAQNMAQFHKRQEEAEKIKQDQRHAQQEAWLPNPEKTTELNMYFEQFQHKTVSKRSNIQFMQDQTDQT